MPRGVPHAKRDEVPMRFTLFNIPPQMNQKQGGSHYLKSEEQTLWGRNKSQRSKPAEAPEGRRGFNVIVIHPGSRFLRIGRASDVFPLGIPNVIARKSKIPVPAPVYVGSASRPSSEKEKGFADSKAETNTSDADQQEPWNPIDPKRSPISSSLRDRMLFYKLHIVPKATEICKSFNEQVRPEIIADHNDPSRVEWIEGDSTNDVYVGEEALRLADAHKIGYTVRWPFHGSRFNSAAYAQVGAQALLNDVETIWRSVLRDSMNIKPENYKDFSVVLIVPDLFERSYVRELANILLMQMGFRQICVQQESISATFGAGISNACVIDAGAVKTSIAIVDEGMVLPDTRLSLNMGGDDITDFLLTLLKHIRFPYREADLSRSYDWKLIEQLKSSICTLAEADVAMNVHSFIIRRPGKQTEKYAYRAYNEIILAPMCLFEPRVIDFERKLFYTYSLWSRDVGEEIVEQANDQITQAMIISTQHLLPLPAPPAPPQIPTVTPTFPVMESALEEEGYGRPVFSVAPQMAQAGSAEPQVGAFASGRKQSKFISLDASDFEPAQGNILRPTPRPTIHTSFSVPVDAETNQSVAPPEEGSHNQPEAATDAREPTLPRPVNPHPGGYPGGFGIDVAFEAGKLPLDVAIFNCARAAGGDEKIRKYLQAVLVIGGTALIPGMGHALESRLQAIASPLVSNMEKVQIIPTPQNIDPRVLCWKGGANLGKMDAVVDLWVSRPEWDALGMRALKERSFFL